MPAAKPLTRAQTRENNAFLKQLRRTGNASTAARALGFGRGRFDHRRRQHPTFATRWEAALVLAHVALTRGRAEEGDAPRLAGEPYIRRSVAGRWQVRRNQPGLIDHAGRQRFLVALSASANVALSAAATGFSRPTLYRERQRNPAFAREWRLALQMGYDRLELALLEAGLPESFTEDDWRRNEPPALPPMTANQALQLMYLHQKEARLWTSPVPDRLRPGETWQARSVQMGLIAEARRERDRERFKLAEAERLARGEPTYIDWTAEGVTLPDLSQVSGWSKADPTKTPADPTRALFGGWRMDELEARRANAEADQGGKKKINRMLNRPK